MLVGEFDRRFDQVKMKPVRIVEKVLLQASNSLDFQESLQVLQASCFCNNFDFFWLTHQLHMVKAIFSWKISFSNLWEEKLNL